MACTISDLLADVPEGQSRLFQAKRTSTDDDRFVEVRSNLNYEPYVTWRNRPEFEKNPWTGARVKPRIGLDTIVNQPDLRFGKKLAKLVDFIQPGTGAYLVSPALLVVIERLDPGSLEVMPVVIKARDGEAPFNLVMPNRLLEAVDPDRCDVIIESTKVGEQWLKRARFPNGVVFRSNMVEGIHNFADIDAMQTWFWSKELLSAVRGTGLRGVVASVPATLPTRDVDSF